MLHASTLRQHADCPGYILVVRLAPQGEKALQQRLEAICVWGTDVRLAHINQGPHRPLVACRHRLVERGVPLGVACVHFRFIDDQ